MGQSESIDEGRERKDRKVMEERERESKGALHFLPFLSLPAAAGTIQDKLLKIEHKLNSFLDFQSVA